MADNNKPTSEYMRKLGKKGGNATKKKRGKAFFRRIAKKSHPRKEYKGGRKKQTEEVTPTNGPGKTSAVSNG